MRSEGGGMAARQVDLLDHQQEIEVIKSVLLRETYLLRLRQLNEQLHAEADKAVQRGRVEKRVDDLFIAMPPDVVDLLDLVRSSTVDTVEAIRRWKLAKRDGGAYLWNGVNYLLRIPRDLDYLSKSAPLVAWLRCDVKRNPFVVLQPMLGTRAVDNVKDLIGSLDAAYLHIPRHTFFKRRRLKTEPSPYLTPVINDVNLLPPPIKPNKRDGSHSSAEGCDSLQTLHSKGVDADDGRDGLHPPSVVDGPELRRIRRAEQLILEEEQAFGRYALGSDGQLVLSAPADATDFVMASTKSNRRATVTTAAVETVAENQCNVSGATCLTERPTGDAGPQPSTCAIPSLPMDVRDDPPQLKRARKMGSDLFLVTAAGTTGHVRPMARPDRLHRLDADMHYVKEQLKEYEAIQNRLKLELACVQARLYPGDRSVIEGSQEEVTDDDQAPQHLHPHGEEEQEADRRRLQELCAALRQLEREVATGSGQLDFLQQCKARLLRVMYNTGSADFDSSLQQQRVALRAGQVLEEDEVLAMALEDHGATQVQKYTRGLIKRSAAERYRVTMARMAVCLQAIVRGFLTRRRVRPWIRKHLATRKIQATWRSWYTRGRIAALQLARRHDRAVRPLQTAIRGWMGRRRAHRRRVFVTSSKAAMEAVSQRGLVPEDLVELGDRILKCLRDPSEPFPPSAVLGLVRLVALVLGTSENRDYVTSYTLMGSQYRFSVATDELTWSNAMRMMRRPNKLLRKLRALASEPLRVPPRVLRVPPQCFELFGQLQTDPYFTIEAMSSIGAGSKCAAGLLKWYSGLQTVYLVQADFALSSQTCIPRHLKVLRALHRRRRALSLDTEIRGAAFDAAKLALEARITAELHFRHEKTVVKRELAALGVCERTQGKAESEQHSMDVKLMSRYHTTLNRLVHERENLQRKLNIARQERVLADGLAQRGEQEAKQRLRALREAEYRAGEALRVKVDEINMCEDGHARRLRQCSGETQYPAEILHVTRELGRAMADMQLAELYRREYVDSLGGVNGAYYISGLRGTAKEIYLQLDVALTTHAMRMTELRRRVDGLAREYEANVFASDVDMVMSDIMSQKWDSPTKAQLAYETEEDEARAQEEASVMVGFLTPEIAAELRHGPVEDKSQCSSSWSPLLVVLAMDCPRDVKKRVYRFLEIEFPGMFTCLGAQRLECRADFEACYKAFLDKHHVVAEYDIGMTYTRRRAFLGAMFSLKRGANLLPRLLLITGGPQDSAGRGCDWSERTALTDLSVIKDSRLRQIAQQVNLCLFLLGQPAALQDLQAVLSDDRPPSNRSAPPMAFVLVMSVLLILVTTTCKPRPLHEMDLSLLWQAARLAFQKAHELPTILWSVQFKTVSRELLTHMVTVYLSHPDWPKRELLSSEQEPALVCLVEWVVLTVELMIGVSTSAGPAEPLQATFKDDTFDVVLPVTASDMSLSAEDSRGVCGGVISLEHALPQLARLVALDRRVCARVRRFDDALCVVQCYHLSSRILFTVYDPKLCRWHYCFVPIEHVGRLLETNFTNVDNFIVKCPPKLIYHVYEQLMDLLSFKCVVPGENVVRRLCCERAGDVLYEGRRRVAGHILDITAREEGKGELVFTLKAPLMTAEHEYRVTVPFEELMWLLEHGDKDLEVPAIQRLGDLPATEDTADDDVDKLVDLTPTMALVLYAVMDRLTVRPTAMSMAHRQETRLPSCIAVGEPLLRARMRRGGGPGLRLFRRLVKTQLYCAIVTVYECGGPGGLLRIEVYDVASARTTELRVPAAQRAILLPPVDVTCITYHETQQAQSFVSALLARITWSEEHGRFEWEVSSHEMDQLYPTYGEAILRGGLDCCGTPSYVLFVYVKDRVYKHTFTWPDLEAVAESAGTLLDGHLVERYLEDPDFRYDLFCMVADTVQEVTSTGTPEGAACLTVRHGSVIEPLLLESASAKATHNVSEGVLPQIQDTVVHETPTIVARSRSERRLLLRTRLTMHKVEDNGGGEVTTTHGVVEVRVFESFSSGPPQQVYTVVIVDREQGGAAARHIVGRHELEMVVEPEKLELLEPSRQVELVEYLVHRRTRLIIQTLPYKKVFTVEFRPALPQHKPPKPLPPPPEKPPVELDLSSAVLLFADTRAVSGVRCRVLAFFLTYGTPRLTYIAVNRLQQIRCSCTRLWHTVCSDSGLKEIEVKERNDIQQVARQLACFLRFFVDEQGNRALRLPYYHLKHAGGKNQTRAVAAIEQ